MSCLKSKEIDIVVCGHLCLDITPQIERKKEEVFIPGKLVNIGKLVLSTGGAVSNTGLSLFRLGAKVEFIAKIGDDFAGREIINFLKKFTGLKKFKGIKIEKGQQTSYSIILSPLNIDRIILHNPTTNDTFSYQDIDFEMVKKAKIFHFGYPPLMRKMYIKEGEELLKIFKRVKDMNVTTSLDMALPDPESESGKINWRNILKKVIPYTDIFLPSFEEIFFMLTPEKFLKLKKEKREFFNLNYLKKISEEILKMGGKIIGIKCGKYGFYIRTADREKIKEINVLKKEILENFSEREIFVKSYKVKKIASALGAGDAAVAGFLMGILKGEKIEDTLKLANCVGAQNLSCYDAISGIKSLKETKRMIKMLEKCGNNINEYG